MAEKLVGADGHTPSDRNFSRPFGLSSEKGPSKPLIPLKPAVIA